MTARAPRVRKKAVDKGQDAENAALIEKAKRGDGAAFETLWTRALPRIGRQAAKFLPFLSRTRTRQGRVEMDDIVSEARIGAWRAILDFDVTRGDALNHIVFGARSAMQGYLRREVTARRGFAEDPEATRSANDNFLADVLIRKTDAGESEAGDSLVPDPSNAFEAQRREQAHAVLVQIVAAMPLDLRAWAEAILLDIVDVRGRRASLAERFSVGEETAKYMSARVHEEARRIGRELGVPEWLGLGDNSNRVERRVDDRAELRDLLRHPGAASAVTYLASGLHGATGEVARARLVHADERREPEPQLALASRLGVRVEEVGRLERAAARLMMQRARDEGVLDLLDEAA